MNSLGIDHSLNLTRRDILAFAAAFSFLRIDPVGAVVPAILVHKDPSCGCCNGWVRHLRQAGFAVTVDERSQLQTVRQRLGVPSDLTACHTAEVNGYVLEGHVPAAAVQRLLKEQPKAAGLAVPGMPMGSPGMEGGRSDKYEVVLFGTSSGRSTFMRFVGPEVSG